MSSAQGADRMIRHAFRIHPRPNLSMQMADHLKRWTLAELHRLPDDGNRYELVRGELFVTPAPSIAHEAIVNALASRIEPYVIAHRLGQVFRPRAVVVLDGSEVEPDLMVRQVPRPLPRHWRDMPPPILLVEVVSDSTYRRDNVQKRSLYLDGGVPDYWIMDGEQRTIRMVRPGEDDVSTGDMLPWHPTGANKPLVIDVVGLFREAIG